MPVYTLHSANICYINKKFIARTPMTNTQQKALILLSLISLLFLSLHYRFLITLLKIAAIALCCTLALRYKFSGFQFSPLLSTNVTYTDTKFGNSTSLPNFSDPTFCTSAFGRAVARHLGSHPKILATLNLEKASLRFQQTECPITIEQLDKRDPDDSMSSFSIGQLLKLITRPDSTELQCISSTSLYAWEGLQTDVNKSATLDKEHTGFQFFQTVNEELRNSTTIQQAFNDRLTVKNADILEHCNLFPPSQKSGISKT